MWWYLTPCHLVFAKEEKRFGLKGSGFINKYWSWSRDDQE